MADVAAGPAMKPPDAQPQPAGGEDDPTAAAPAAAAAAPAAAPAAPAAEGACALAPDPGLRRPARAAYGEGRGGRRRWRGGGEGATRGSQVLRAG
jgi:hypothetical protein